MLIKMLRHGTGSAARAASYVLDEKDHMNIVRPHVEVLCGDPHLFAKIADSSPFKHKYTSAVIAFTVSIPKAGGQSITIKSYSSLIGSNCFFKICCIFSLVTNSISAPAKFLFAGIKNKFSKHSSTGIIASSILTSSLKTS